MLELVLVLIWLIFDSGADKILTTKLEIFRIFLYLVVLKRCHYCMQRRDSKGKL